MQYREDIYGLRGFILILIILYSLNFHQYPNSFYTGFFLSVDIFFVISGYLITNIILDQHNQKIFSFIEFYKKRIRRMLPSLIVVLIISTILGFFILVPSDMIDHAKSVVSSIFFSSNFYFHFTGQQLYQSEATHLKPLLHTWTLSIEEQFYLFYPALIFLILKFFKKRLFEIILLLTLTSLAINYFVITSPSITFYITPFRAWQIGCGCLAAIFNRQENFNIFLGYNKTKKILYEIIFIIFLASLLFYDVKHHYSFQIACVFSAAFLIAINNKNRTISKIFFSQSLFVKLGFISYSVYLFQQMILAYLKNWNITFLDDLVNKLLIITIIFLVSILNYRLIEKPFRYKFNLKLKYFILGFFVILFVNLMIIYNKGFVKNLTIDGVITDNKYLHASWLKKHKPYDFYKFSENSKKKILVVGNSYGWDMFNTLKLNKRYVNNYQFSFKNYDFLESVYGSLKNKEQELVNLIKEADIVLFSTAWRLDNAFIFLDKSIAEINNLNPSIDIIIQSQIPEFFYEKRKYGFKNMKLTRIDEFLIKNKRLPNLLETKELKKIYYNDYKTRSKTTNTNIKLQEIAIKNNLHFINSEEFFCNSTDKECDFLTNANKKIYWDQGHLTEAGWIFFGNKFFKLNYLNLKQ